MASRTVPKGDTLTMVEQVIQSMKAANVKTGTVTFQQSITPSCVLTHTVCVTFKK